MPRLFPAMLPLALCVACVTPDSTTPPSERPWNCSPRLHLSSVWSFLSEKYDADRDGVVTRAEYARGDRQFDNYDRNRNGALESDDFPEDTFFNGFNHMVVMNADADEDETVTATEWAAFSKQIDSNGDGEMDSDEVTTVLGDWASDWRLFLLSFDQNGDGRFTDVDLAITFRDQDFNGDAVLSGVETTGWAPPGRDRSPAPEPGSEAPDFTLSFAQAPQRTFQLSQAVRERPVALVFGSYT